MTAFSVSSRLAALRERIRATDADALLISQPETRAYLSGFTGSAGWVLVTADRALMATDFRYFEQVALEAPAYELVKIKTTLAEALPEMLASTGVQRLAFEADHATFANVQEWSKAAPEVTWVPTKGIGAGLRAIKDACEIAELRAAVALADEALAAALSQARPGMTESDLAWLIESYLRTHGASAAFEIIVACGPNGARPHARAGNDPLVEGVPIVIDMGARVRSGYCSDLTRTVCLGQPADADRFWRVYDTVLRAQMAAEAAIRPGLTGAEADAVAREVIIAAGYGDYFGHGLGHGIGLAVHEEPRLSRLNPAPLVAGNVVTVEPGIYLPGWGGVRIEDLVLVTENGVEVLTQAAKTPIL